MTALKQERVRGPNLAVFIKRANGVPMEEALAKADRAGLVMASNTRLSRALVESSEWRSICDVFTCWTGTMTAYDLPDLKLGKNIEYTDSITGIRYVFPVPEEHQGKENVMLVTEHPNFSLIADGNDRVVQAAKVDAVERFPTSPVGWFLGDKNYGIPQGKPIEDGNQDARHLCRMNKRVGLVARGYLNRIDIIGRQYVCVDDRPSIGFGVAVEKATSPFPQVTVTSTGDGELVIRGSAENVVAAAGLLRDKDLILLLHGEETLIVRGCSRQVYEAVILLCGK